MRLAAVGLFLSTVLGWCTAAHADTRDSSSEARDFMRRYAECILPGQHSEAVRLVTSTVDPADFKIQFPSLVATDVVLVVPMCQPVLALPFGIKFNFDGEPLRFALAEALIKRDWKLSGLSDFSAIGALAVFPVRPKVDVDTEIASISSTARKARIQADYDKSVATYWLMQFGECVTRRDATNVKVWALSEPDSTNEKDTINLLGQVFGSCLADGESLKFNKPLLRGVMAVSYVRLAEASRAAQGAAM